MQCKIDEDFSEGQFISRKWLPQDWCGTPMGVIIICNSPAEAEAMVMLKKKITSHHPPCLFKISDYGSSDLKVPDGSKKNIHYGQD